MHSNSNSNFIMNGLQYEDENDDEEEEELVIAKD